MWAEKHGIYVHHRVGLLRCQVCTREVRDTPGARVAHARAHVRAGKAREWRSGGTLRWERVLSPPRLPA